MVHTPFSNKLPLFCIFFLVVHTPFSNILPLFCIFFLCQMVIEYAVPLFIISIAYGRMGTRLWLTRTPGTAQDKRDECILTNKKKVTLGQIRLGKPRLNWVSPAQFTVGQVKHSDKSLKVKTRKTSSHDNLTTLFDRLIH